MTEEQALIIIAMLMRIYDVQMALLTKADPATGQEVYEAHDSGKHFNPVLYIPETTSEV